MLKLKNIAHRKAGFFFFLTALRRYEKERRGVEEGEREGESRQGYMKQTENRM